MADVTGEIIATSWEEYDELLERFDAGELEFEPVAPDAPDDSPADIRTGLPAAPDPISNRTEQRRTEQRRRLIRPALDHGANVETAVVRADAVYDRRTGMWRGRCPAPKAHFPNVNCEAEFWGPKGQKYCSPACQKRARRHHLALLDDAECPPSSMSGHLACGGDNSPDIHSGLPAGSRPISDLTVPLFEVPAP